MDKSSRIFVAGHRGMVGSAIVRRLNAAGYSNLLLRSRADLDLAAQRDVFEFLATEKPDYIFLAAAKVGGIHANNTAGASSSTRTSPFRETSSTVHIWRHRTPVVPRLELHLSARLSSADPGRLSADRSAGTDE